MDIWGSIHSEVSGKMSGDFEQTVLGWFRWKKNGRFVDLC